MLEQAYRDAMDAGHNPNRTICYDYKSPHGVNWAVFLESSKWNQPVKTGVPIEDLRYLAQRLTDIPATFQLHSRIQKLSTIVVNGSRRVAA